MGTFSYDSPPLPALVPCPVAAMKIPSKGSLRKEEFWFDPQSDVAATEAREAGRIAFVVRDVSARLLLLFRTQCVTGCCPESRWVVPL